MFRHKTVIQILAGNMDCQVLFLFTVLLCVSIASSLNLPSTFTDTCPSGQTTTSDTCDEVKTCPTGSRCYFGKCCQGITGSSLKLPLPSSSGSCLIGQTATGDNCDEVNTCPTGSTCYSGSCCQSRFTFLDILVCPEPLLMLDCRGSSSMEDMICKQSSDCRTAGQVCCRDGCGRNYCYTSPPGRR